MVDTMTIYYDFKNYGKYEQVKNIFSDYTKHFNEKQSLHKEGNKYITYAFAQYGMEQIWFTQKINYRIHIKLRPKLMIEKNNYNDVFRAYDIPKLYKEFKNHMHSIGGDNVSDLRKWKVKRIDYAVDIIVPQKEIPVYIALFKQGNIPENLLHHERTQIYQNETNNLYLEGSSYRINFYDRFTTVSIKQQAHPDKAFHNIESLYGVFRFEVQLRDIDITKLKKSGRIHKNCVEDFLNPELSKCFILKNYKTIIGTGDYYSYPVALSKCKSSTQRSMLKLVYDTGSIYEAKRVFLEDNDNKRKAEKQFSEIIKKLNANGINPVTMEAGKMENLYNKIIYQIEGSNCFLIRRRKINYEE